MAWTKGAGGGGGGGCIGREGGGGGWTPPPPMVPPTPAPKAPEKFFKAKPSWAKGTEENFASNSGRGGGSRRGETPLLLWLSAVLIHPWGGGGGHDTSGALHATASPAIFQAQLCTPLFEQPPPPRPGYWGSCAQARTVFDTPLGYEPHGGRSRSAAAGPIRRTGRTMRPLRHPLHRTPGHNSHFRGSMCPGFPSSSGGSGHIRQVAGRLRSAQPCGNVQRLQVPLRHLLVAEGHGGHRKTATRPRAWRGDKAQHTVAIFGRASHKTPPSPPFQTCAYSRARTVTHACAHRGRTVTHACA